MQRTCDGTDPNLINAFDLPGCRCGLVFDDVERMTVFPHARIPTQAEKAAILDDLLAAHADCDDSCETARIVRLIAVPIDDPVHPDRRPTDELRTVARRWYEGLRSGPAQ